MIIKNCISEITTLVKVVCEVDNLDYNICKEKHLVYFLNDILHLNLVFNSVSGLSCTDAIIEMKNYIRERKLYELGI